jgi:hypothetical protein
MGDEGVKIPGLTTFFKLKELFCRPEEYLNIPSFAVDAGPVTKTV